MSFGTVCACQKVELEEDSEPTEGGTIGGGDQSTPSELDKENAATVANLSEIGEGQTVTLTGYIVGFAKSSTISATVFDTTGAVETNIVLADTPTEKSPDNCAAVQLVKGTSVRADLNLVAHPENIHRKIFIIGTKTNYYRAPGLKSPEAWSWDNSAEPPESGDNSDDTDEPSNPDIPSQPIISREGAIVLEGC